MLYASEPSRGAVLPGEEALDEREGSGVEKATAEAPGRIPRDGADCSRVSSR